MAKKCRAKDGKCNGAAQYQIKCDGLLTDVCEHHFDVHLEHAKNFKLVRRL
jgi:phage anti-repressor protein